MMKNENNDENPTVNDDVQSKEEKKTNSFTEAAQASSRELVRLLREHTITCGDLRFNFEPTQEQLDEYFRNYRYKKIDRTRDPIIKKIKAMFECYEWKWITVETDYFMMIALPIPLFDHATYRLFDIRALGKEKTAAFILFMIVRMMGNADELVESWYHFDFKENYLKRHYLFHEKVYDFIDKTMEFPMAELSVALKGIFDPWKDID